MKGQEIRQGLKTAEEDVRVSPMLRARTLRAMRESGKPKTGRVKKKASFVLAAALVCVMLTAVALAAANRAGMLDFIGRYPNAELPDNAADYVHPADAAGKTAGLSAHVREEFYDGRTLRLTVDVAMENQKDSARSGLHADGPMAEPDPYGGRRNGYALHSGCLPTGRL